MKIFKIQVENYRLLKKFSIDIEKELSLVIGKNNTGKTSLLLVIDKFLNNPSSFKFNDFNIEIKKEINELLDAGLIAEEDYKPKAIKLKIFIDYGEEDDLSNISRVMMDLDPENNVIVLGFEFTLHYANYQRMKSELISFKEKESQKKAKNDDYRVKTTSDFIERRLIFFNVRKYSFEYNKKENKANEDVYVNLDDEKISVKDIISFKYISARRDVTNKEADKTLSGQTSQIYEKTEENDEQSKAIEAFKDQLIETDANLSDIYTNLFKDVVKKVEIFGGIKPNESEIKIISSLQHRELLKGNTTVIYNHDEENQLPEYYNGLGYMNLISMIFEIEIKRQELRGDKNKKPSDINLLFIEEPEAHTHPQMQYVFIKNIKSLLKDGIVREDGQNRELQYIISTHSSHIVADSEFDDVKYLKKVEINSVVAKNLKDLKKQYEENGEEQNYRFLKQYLTLNRAELFFADKAIFIEGDTERILLPAMMWKIDNEYPENPMLSQNISIIEVGAYSQIFEKFIDFIGLKKGLIITDIDSYYLTPIVEKDGVTPKTYKNGNPKFVLTKCSAGDEKAMFTSNSALAYYFGQKAIDFYKKLTLAQKKLYKNNGIWTKKEDGNILVTYQTEVNELSARSFEDAFFELNRDFIISAENSFPSLTKKWFKKYLKQEINSFEFAEKAVEKKTSLAIEILLNSKTTEEGTRFSNWQIPHYIKEGLQWLKED
jgi:predicted ATP-dependent endonuclease of OLD family